MKSFYSLIVFIHDLQFRYRKTISFLLVFIAILITDIIFNIYYIPIMETVNSLFDMEMAMHSSIDTGFVPEIWAGILALVFGTLIIVIAIAAESSPKLIDLYMKDWLSLIYIWFLILASIHSIFLMFYAKEIPRLSSLILNTYAYLTIASIFALPYIFYIMLYSKTSNVIKTISKQMTLLINKIKSAPLRYAMENKKIIKKFQFELMASFDQMDDLLTVSEFKEIKADIISKMSSIIQLYIREKQSFNKNFFLLTSAIRNNATFRTYTNLQLLEIERDQAFFEIKAFRLFGNSYIKMLELDQFDIASLILSELVDIGKVAIESKDQKIIEHVNVRFNTLFRFAIKHAIKNNEARNLYNLAFHYSNMIQTYIENNLIPETEVCYERFRYYGNEVYKNAFVNPALYFIVDTLTFELRKNQILISENNWEEKTQKKLLNVVLQLDQPPNYSKEDIDKSILGGNNGTRRIQIGLALYYIKKDKLDFVKMIIQDYLDDLTYFEEKDFKKIIEGQLFLLSIFGPTFWEDTDRGNMNIYYTPYKEQIPKFKEMIFESINNRIEKLEFDVQYLALEVDRLLRKKQKQDGFLNEIDRVKLEELQQKIAVRNTSEKYQKEFQWDYRHDLLYILICVAFFADEEIDESEKRTIHTDFKKIIPSIDDQIFNEIFYQTTERYIKLRKKARQEHYKNTLENIKQHFSDNPDKLIEILNSMVNIINADKYIHENEIKLLDIALSIWGFTQKFRIIKQEDKLELVQEL